MAESQGNDQKLKHLNFVDAVISKFDAHAPPSAKKLVSEAHTAIVKASHVAKQLTEEARADGPMAALTHARQIFKQMAVDQLAASWYKVDTFPPLHGVTQLALPTAAYWSEMYNRFVTGMKTRGYTIFCYAPLVPVEEIAKAYNKLEAGATKKTDGRNLSQSESKPENMTAAG